MFQPHRVELAHLAPQVLQGQVGLGLSELAGRQLLLQAGDVILRYVLSLAFTGLARLAVSKIFLDPDYALPTYLELRLENIFHQVCDLGCKISNIHHF